jgi:hypothetical protein
MRLTALIAACGVLTAPAFAVAQEAAAPANGAAAKAPAVQLADSRRKKPERVCKTIMHTGSRLGTTSVCKTQKEWDDQSAQYRKTLERQQLNPSKVISQ